MKVLILSCSTGEGHNSAAYALREQFDIDGVESKVVDPIMFKSLRAQKLVADCYNNLIRTSPKTFGKVYKLGKWYDSTRLASPIYAANSTYAGELFKYIEKHCFDAVVSTHLYGMEVMTAIRKKYNKNMRSYGVLTDYTAIPFFCDNDLDACFIPHDDIRAEIKGKLAKSRICASGIPVSPKFLKDCSMSDARLKLGIPSECKMMLVMSGGIGGGDVKGLCNELVAVSSEDTRIYVLTGHNELLKQKLENEYTDGNVCAVGFTTDVDLYMRASDVLLSKPGGLSSTEAAVSNIPIVHINAIPGCESSNADFFENHGMSVKAFDNHGAAVAAADIVNDPQLGEHMRRQQRLVINRNAARDIVRMIVND